jgi:hypothetical protein
MFLQTFAGSRTLEFIVIWTFDEFVHLHVIIRAAAILMQTGLFTTKADD